MTNEGSLFDKDKGIIIRPSGKLKEHDILLFTENLGALVNGYLEYKIISGDNPN